MNRDRIGDAVREARASVAIAPRNVIAHDLLGRALAMNGNLAEARREFEAALEIEPAFEQAREDLRQVQR